jgi:hypothetical protein
MTRDFRVATALLVTLVLGPDSALLWGEHGHRIVGGVAAEILPNEMPAFFRQAADELRYLNPEPDRWKDRVERETDPALDGLTFSEHFIDLEEIPAMRREAFLASSHRVAFADSLRTIGKHASSVGVLPYRIIELTQSLRSGFRRWRAETDSTRRRWIEQRIINDAGILGHYVADGANPAHTSIHHNGWIGDNPNGFTTDTRFHARFESEFVQAMVDQGDVRRASTAPARVFPNVRTSVLAFLRESHGQLVRLYTLEKELPFDARNGRPPHKAFAVDRLAAGATMLRDLWYTAWITSD